MSYEDVSKMISNKEQQSTLTIYSPEGNVYTHKTTGGVFIKQRGNSNLIIFLNRSDGKLYKLVYPVDYIIQAITDLPF